MGKTNRALKQCGKEGSDGRSCNEVKQELTLKKNANKIWAASSCNFLSVTDIPYYTKFETQLQGKCQIFTQQTYNSQLQNKMVYLTSTLWTSKDFQNLYCITRYIPKMAMKLKQN